MFHPLTNCLAVSWPVAMFVPPAFVVAGLLMQYVLDCYNIRSNGIKGPILAQLSDLWLGWVAAHGHRSEVVHELHKKYGMCDIMSYDMVH